MVKKSYVHWEDRTILNLCLHKSAVQTNKKLKIDITTKRKNQLHNCFGKFKSLSNNTNSTKVQKI